MHDRRAFQQVPYLKLSQRTFLFLMLPPSTYLRHSNDEVGDWNQSHVVYTHLTLNNSTQQFI